MIHEPSQKIQQLKTLETEWNISELGLYLTEAAVSFVKIVVKVFSREIKDRPRTSKQKKIFVISGVEEY